MKPRLIQNQTLQRKMNQTLLQSIHLLQYTGVELLDYINEVAKENPLIEEINYDFDMENYRRSNQQHDRPEIGEINKAVETMYDQLRNQLLSMDYPKKLEPVIDYGIDSINEDGYLDVDLDQWMEDCQTTFSTIQEAIQVIQSLEPAGIGARTLPECIRLQLERMGICYEFIEDLLDQHLEWIAHGNIEAIEEQYKMSKETAQAMIDHIRLCHPKPGHLLDTKAPEYIIPEAAIYKEDQMWKIKFYKWASPMITINQEYQNLRGLEKEVDIFLQQKQRQVEWLKQVIHFRTSTLEKVIQVIVEKQFLFFEEGAGQLQPLTLREIASEVDSHLSTVSRTISHKYVQTPHGVFPIKFFMQSGVKQHNGMKVANTVIKQYIIRLIEKEDKSKPLSDQAISNLLLQRYGIKIARRTVMKYREQLNIPSSMKRRRHH